MAASGDVTIAQDGGHAKLHPYLVALVRWCVSCLWSTATVLLHRLMTAPLPQIAGTASKPVKPRPAGKDHLHPEPKVECEVLHQPETHNLDVIFVHGLYGSLCNTWRQGEWRSKYRVGPEKVHLRRPTDLPAPCTCPHCEENKNNNQSTIFNNYENYEANNLDENYDNTFNNSENMNSYNSDAFTNIDDKFYNDITKILPKNDEFTTEKFYNNTLLDQVEIIDNYETQAQFVSDLFKNCDNNCDFNAKSNINKEDGFHNDAIANNNAENRINKETKGESNCMCNKENINCDVGCGCVCDACYSPCWPRDWIPVDYPDARVISVNYTSDPHLWRPLWIKQTKRLCLHERAEQMMDQLLELGVGRRPIVWVGHSKGGLFIKQIYCEAYDAYLKTHPEQIQELNQYSEQTDNETSRHDVDNNHSITVEHKSNNVQNSNNNCENLNNNLEKDNMTDLRVNRRIDGQLKSSTNEEDPTALKARASLWASSVGFMLYSVPHRGSPLADIKTPITARSVELLEISKDCQLVLSLQSRWLAAAHAGRSVVRSLVETRRTLMSVLKLTIVCANSADPGIGALCGVSVDHREICKPTSRRCFLYTELTNLIRAALLKQNNYLKDK